MITSEILRAAKAKIDTPEKWCKGEYATDIRGNGLHAASPLACKWCSVGAVQAITFNKDWGDVVGSTPEAKAVRALHKVVEPRVIHIMNDDPHTTHDDVMRVFDKAIRTCQVNGD